MGLQRGAHGRDLILVVVEFRIKATAEQPAEDGYHVYRRLAPSSRELVEHLPGFLDGGARDPFESGTKSRGRQHLWLHQPGRLVLRSEDPVFGARQRQDRSAGDELREIALCSLRPWCRATADAVQRPWPTLRPSPARAGGRCAGCAAADVGWGGRDPGREAARRPCPPCCDPPEEARTPAPARPSGPLQIRAARQALSAPSVPNCAPAASTRQIWPLDCGPAAGQANP